MKESRIIWYGSKINRGLQLTLTLLIAQYNCLCSSSLAVNKF